MRGSPTLTEAAVADIAAKYAAGGVTRQQLADQYGVRRKVIADIVRRKRWRHVTATPDLKRRLELAAREHGNAKLTVADVLAIRADYTVGGPTLTELAKQYGVRTGTIHAIVSGKTWTHI